jgi:hypothetical protein
MFARVRVYFGGMAIMPNSLKSSDLSHKTYQNKGTHCLLNTTKLLFRGGPNAGSDLNVLNEVRSVKGLLELVTDTRIARRPDVTAAAAATDKIRQR